MDLGLFELTLKVTDSLLELGDRLVLQPVTTKLMIDRGVPWGPTLTEGCLGVRH